MTPDALILESYLQGQRNLAAVSAQILQDLAPKCRTKAQLVERFAKTLDAAVTHAEQRMRLRSIEGHQA